MASLGHSAADADGIAVGEARVFPRDRFVELGWVASSARLAREPLHLEEGEHRPASTLAHASAAHGGRCEGAPPRCARASTGDARAAMRPEGGSTLTLLT